MPTDAANPEEMVISMHSHEAFRMQSEYFKLKEAPFCPILHYRTSQFSKAGCFGMLQQILTLIQVSICKPWGGSHPCLHCLCPVWSIFLTPACVSITFDRQKLLSPVWILGQASKTKTHKPHNMVICSGCVEKRGFINNDASRAHIKL